MQRHAFGLGLHHGGVAVDVDDEARQAVTFRVDETEAVGVGIMGQAHDLAHLIGLVEAFEEEPFVDFAVVEAEHLDGDTLRLAEAGAEDVAVIVGDGDGVARLQAFGGVVDGAREYPRMEALDGFLLAGIESYDRIEWRLFHDVRILMQR